MTTILSCYLWFHCLLCLQWCPNTFSTSTNHSLYSVADGAGAELPRAPGWGRRPNPRLFALQRQHFPAYDLRRYPGAAAQSATSVSVSLLPDLRGGTRVRTSPSPAGGAVRSSLTIRSRSVFRSFWQVFIFFLKTFLLYFLYRFSGICEKFPALRLLDAFGLVHDARAFCKTYEMKRVAVNTRAVSAVARPTPASVDGRSMWNRRCRLRLHY